MTIQCRTGCGQQITYEEFEFHDGFVYFLPRNGDLSIHKCPNLPENGIGEWPNKHPEQEGKELQDPEYYELDGRGITVSGPNRYDLEHGYLDSYSGGFAQPYYVLPSDNPYSSYRDISLLRAALLAHQLKSVLFPAPFMIYYLDLHEEPPTTDLTMLSMFYKDLGDLSNACLALEIQNMISHDQSKEIFKLRKQMEEKNPIKSEFSQTKTLSEFAITVSDLQVWIRKTERHLKDFIRKKYIQINKLREEFPDIFEEAERRRIENSKLVIIKENDNVIENLDWRSIIDIIKTNTRTKKWKEFDYDEINYLYTIKNCRNVISHSSVKNVEDLFSKDDVALCHIYCKKIIKLLDDQEKR